MKTYAEILSAMGEKYRELTGFDADSASDIGIRLRVLARQVAELYGEMGTLYDQVFPQTSGGEYLERHAACRGLSRKAATPAEGKLRFFREQPAQGDTPVPVGVICATRGEEQIQFVTTAEALLPAGGTAVEVAARAVSPGGEGNVAGGAVCVMVSAAPGFSGVVNSEPFGGGADEETDEALRARLLDAYRSISNGTNAAFYYDIAMQEEGVSSAAVLPRARGRGTVDVVIQGMESENGEEIAARLADRMEKAREVNVDVAVRPATERGVSVTAQIAPREGYDFEQLAEACQALLLERIGDLGVGEPLLLAQLTSSLLSLEGVYNAAVTSPGQDIYPAADAVIQPTGVAVTRMVTG